MDIKTIADAPCKCLIYHPVGDEWDRVYETWVATGKSDMIMVVQLFGHCPNREEK